MSQTPEATADDLRPEYDLGRMQRRGRGLYADRYGQGTNVRLLDPELATRFRDNESVNEALREYLRLKDIAPSG